MKFTTLFRHRNVVNKGNQYAPEILYKHLSVLYIHLEFKEGTIYTDSALNNTQFLIGYGHLISQYILSVYHRITNFNFTGTYCITSFIPVDYIFRRTKCISCEGALKNMQEKPFCVTLSYLKLCNSIV